MTKRDWLRRVWTALAVSVVALITAAGCSDYGSTFQGNTGAFISSLSPSNTNAGGPDFTLTVFSSTGGFVAQTVVQWNGNTIPTTYVSSTTVTATISAAMITTPGLAAVNTLNPHSGKQDNGLSNVINFIINQPGNPSPTISSISPNNAPAGTATAVTLTVTGTNFLPASSTTGTSTVLWNSASGQATLPATNITSTQITATVDPSLLATAGTAIVTVHNPPNPNSPTGTGGGGTSPNGLTFTITGTSPTNATATTQSASEETPAVSQDGRFVAYTAVQDGRSQIFVKDTCVGADASCVPTSSLVSQASDGTAANGDSHSPSMSADGRYVAFSSAATNLTSDAVEGRQIFLRDTCSGAKGACTPSTQLISTDPQGALVGTEGVLPSVSASGRFVAFIAVTPSHDGAVQSGEASAQVSTPSNVVPNSGLRQVFVRDTCLATANCTPSTARITLEPGDVPATGGSTAAPALSGNAQNVAVSGAATATALTPTTPVSANVLLAATGKKQ